MPIKAGEMPLNNDIAPPSWITVRVQCKIDLNSPCFDVAKRVLMVSNGYTNVCVIMPAVEPANNLSIGLIPVCVVFLHYYYC